MALRAISSADIKLLMCQLERGKALVLEIVHPFTTSPSHYSFLLLRPAIGLAAPSYLSTDELFESFGL